MRWQDKKAAIEDEIEKIDIWIKNNHSFMAVGIVIFILIFSLILFRDWIW